MERDLAVIRARARAGHALRQTLLQVVPATPRVLQEYLAWIAANDTALIEDTLWLCDQVEEGGAP